MSLQALNTTWERSRASGTALLVMLRIADYASPEGFAYPSEKRLAESARCDVRSVRRAISLLQELKEIEVWEWVDDKNARHNGFRIIIGEFSVWEGVRPGDRLPGRAKSTYDKRLPKALRETVMNRDGHRCVYCGSSKDLGIDHIVPRSKNGSDEEENLCCACGPCNASKGARDVDEWTAWKDEREREKARQGDLLDPQDNLSYGGALQDNLSYPDRTPVSYPARAIPALLEPSVNLEPSLNPPTPLLAEPVESHPLPTKVDGKSVASGEAALALDVLATFNAAAGTKFRSKESIGKIVMRIREHPDLTRDDHAAIIERVFAKPWWRGGASPAVIYGNPEIFESSMHATGGVTGSDLDSIATADLDALRGLVG